MSPVPTEIPAATAEVASNEPDPGARRLRWVAALAGAWSALVVLVGATEPTRPSWHFFDAAARILFDPGTARPDAGGLDLYATHPRFQFGPVPVVVAQVVRSAAPHHQVVVASVLIAALAPVIVWLLADAARILDGGQVSTRLVVGASATAIVLPIVWSYLSVASLHLDDALAVTGTCLAAWGVARGRGWLVGIALGLALASKPWAAAFVPVALALPKGQRWRALASAGVVALAAWAPFVIDAPSTVRALGHFRIREVRASALHALGVHDGWTPRWDRAAQVLLGGAAAAWCARTGRWPAAVMAAAAARIALDPSTHPYYTATLVTAVVIWELTATRWRVPVVAGLVALSLAIPRVDHWPWAVRADVRLLVCVALALVAVVAPVATAVPAVAGSERPTA